MAKPKRTAREEIERAFHVSFKLPEQARTLLDQYRDQVAAEARREALLDAAKLAAKGVGRLSDEAAIQHTIVSRLRVAALSDDACSKCEHRRGDHLHNGGRCTQRTSPTTHCACRRYEHPTPSRKEN